jgi:hypothetical protein
MPTYHFRDKKSGEEFSRFLYISELDRFLELHPDFETIPCAPGIISGHNVKPDKGFREMLSAIKKRNPTGKINDFGG